MANIVIGLHNFLITKSNLDARPPFYDAFLNGLKEAGNNVLCFEKQNYEASIKENIPEDYLEKIKKFNPDLFIFFNNQFWDITKHFEAPIVIYDVDSPNLYCNIKLIKSNINRYKFFVNQSSGIETIINVLGANKTNIMYVPPYTNIRSDNNVIPDLNISFLGSCWVWNDFNEPLDFSQQKTTKEERELAFRVYQKYIDNPYFELDYFYNKIGVSDIKKLKFNNSRLSTARISGIQRLRYLTEIADLGLEVRGTNWHSPMLKVFPEVMLSYNIEQVLNYKETESFFNRSKIGFNTKHIQAKSGFSWRVCDILASNACLVTQRADDLKDLGFKVPMFESPSEAREICKKLLKNENMRKDIVAHSNELIEKNHRLKSSLEEIESFLSMKLHSNNTGTLEIIKNYNTPKKQVAKIIKPAFPEINNLKGFNKYFYKIAKYYYKKIKFD